MNETVKYSYADIWSAKRHDENRVQQEMRRSRTAVLLCNRTRKREGEHLRVSLPPKASKEWQRTETAKVSAWVIRLGWRVCRAKGPAKLRRSARVNGDKGRQETVSGPKRMGEKLVA